MCHKLLSLCVLCISIALAGCSKSSTPPATPATQKTPADLPVFFRSDSGLSAQAARVDADITLVEATQWSQDLTDIAESGHSSPIVANGRIYISAADDQEYVLAAFNLDDGSLLWRKVLGPHPDDSGEVEPGEFGLACSTPCAVGDRIITFFSNGWAYCLDSEGKLQWSVQVAPEPVNSFGLAASPVIYKDMVIFQIDLDEDEQSEEFRSFITALAVSDGSERWRQKRDVWPSWSTPVVLVGSADSEADDMLVTTAAPWAIAYNPHDGTELWRCGELIGDVAATAVFDESTFYAFSDPSGDLLAVDISGSGDVSESAVRWRCETDMPDVASGLLFRDCVYYCGSGMQLHCISTVDGTEKWSAELDTIAYASPIVVGEYICVIDTDGLLKLFNSSGGSAGVAGVAGVAGGAGVVAMSMAFGAEVSATPFAISTGDQAAELIVRTNKSLLRLKLAR